MPATVKILRKLAYWATLTLIFAIPTENSVVLPFLGRVSRAIGLLAAAMWMVTVIARRGVRRPPLFHVLFFSFIIWSGLTFYWSMDPRSTLAGLATYLQIFGMTIMIWDLFRTSPAIIAGLQAFVLGAWVSALRLLQDFLLGPPQAFPVFGRYTLQNFEVDGIALLLALAIPAAWYLALTGGGGSRSYVMRAINLAYLPAGLFTMILTGTRGAALATFPTVVFVIWSAWRTSRVSRFATIGAVVVAALVVVVIAPEEMIARIGTAASDVEAGGRVEIWRGSLDVFSEHPIAGIGLDAHRTAVPLGYLITRGEVYSSFGREAHNTLLSILVETGLVGLVLFGALAATVLRSIFHLFGIARWYWMTQLAVMGIDGQSLSLEGSKAIWFFLALAVAAVPALLGQAVGETEPSGPNGKPQSSAMPRPSIESRTLQRYDPRRAVKSRSLQRRPRSKTNGDEATDPLEPSGTRLTQNGVSPARPSDSLATTSQFDPFEPIRQRPLTVAGFVLLFATLGAVYAARLTPTYVASAGLVVEDARRSSQFVVVRPVEPERYVADQIAVLKSRAVAERASELAAIVDPPAELGVEELLADANFASDLQTDFVTITLRANDPDKARTGANSLGLAYQQVLEDRREADSANALARFDDAIEEAVQRVVDIQEELEATQASSLNGQLLEDQISTIVEELAALRASAGSTDDIRAKANQLAAELQARLLLTEVEDSAPGVTLPLRRLEDALTLLSELTLRRSQLEVDAQLSGTGVALFSPAGPATRTGGTIRSTVSVSVVLGGLVGSGVAYWLSERKRRFHRASQPGTLIGAPLLGEIPLMKSNVVDVELVVEAVPRSPGAEAFHALAAELQSELREIGEREPFEATDRPGKGTVLAVVSPYSFDGKTVVAVNAALATSQAGLRALLLDADRDCQRASSLLAPYGPPFEGIGLGEVVTRSASLGQALTPISLGGRFSIDLLRFGRVGAIHVDTPAGASVFGELATRYDLVVVDLPPLHDEPEARSVVQKVDYAIVVVKHRSAVEGLEELQIRLSLMGVPVLGYVYVHVPRVHHQADSV